MFFERCSCMVPAQEIAPEAPLPVRKPANVRLTSAKCLDDRAPFPSARETGALRPQNRHEVLCTIRVIMPRRRLRSCACARNLLLQSTQLYDLSLELRMLFNQRGESADCLPEAGLRAVDIGQVLGRSRFDLGHVRRTSHMFACTLPAQEVAPKAPMPTRSRALCGHQRPSAWAIPARTSRPAFSDLTGARLEAPRRARSTAPQRRPLHDDSRSVTAFNCGIGTGRVVLVVCWYYINAVLVPYCKTRHDNIAQALSCRAIQIARATPANSSNAS